MESSRLIEPGPERPSEDLSSQSALPLALASEGESLRIVSLRGGRGCGFSPASPIRNQGYPACLTVIPRAVWASKDFIYVGLEIYLPRPDAGTMEDWRFTKEIVESILKCDESLRSNLPD